MMMRRRATSMTMMTRIRIIQSKPLYLFSQKLKLIMLLIPAILLLIEVTLLEAVILVLVVLFILSLVGQHTLPIELVILEIVVSIIMAAA